MKVQTNAGAVELTADMVRPGMVFRSDEAPVFTAASSDDSTQGRWRATDGVLFYPALGFTFLGCDPAHAAREDVERYGVAPDIDAAAHGFARLQDGGAVDLRRTVVNGAVVVAGADSWGSIRTGERFTNFNAWLRPGDLFVGLDMRHARREDVLRLCCLDANRSPSGPGGERCTLAIGDHDTHEDIATGVTWPASRSDP